MSRRPGKLSPALMHFRQRLPELAAMNDAWPLDPEAVEKRDDRGWTSGQLTQRLAIPVAHRQRAVHAALRQMLHQVDEKRQFVGLNALFVKGENVLAGFGAEQKVRILDALGDSFERQHRAEIVTLEKTRKGFVADFRVDGHSRSGAGPSPVGQPSAGRGRTARRQRVNARPPWRRSPNRAPAPGDRCPKTPRGPR